MCEKLKWFIGIMEKMESITETLSHISEGTTSLTFTKSPSDMSEIIFLTYDKNYRNAMPGLAITVFFHF